MGTAVLQQVPDGILTARQALERPRERIDGIFVAAGSELIACVDSLRRVTRLFASLPETLDGPELRGAAEIMSGVSARAAAIASGTNDAGGDLAELMQALGKAAAPIEQLLRIMKTMAMVSINARVAAAGLGSSGVDVGIFWQDMGDLAKSANAVVAQIAERYETLAASVSQATLARARFLIVQREPLRQIARSLTDKLAAVDRQRKVALQAGEETGTTVRNIAERVASTVTSMQAGDAARQRIEHIEQALTRVVEEELPSGVVSLAVELQKRQLRAARDALDRETGSAIESVTAIIGDLHALQQSARKSGLAGERDSALAALQFAARKSAEALARCEMDRRSLDVMAERVVKTVGELLSLASRLEELEHQTRLVSLNAAIRCAHLGERGRALTVIAQQLREMTAETSVATGAAVKALRSAADLSGRLSAGEGAGLAIGTDRLEADVESALGALTQIGQGLFAANAELESETPAVKTRLQQVLALLGTCDEIIDGLDDAGDALLAATADGPASGADGHEGLFGALRKSYSTEAERHIHDELLGAGEPAGTVGVSDEESVDSLLF